MKGIYKIKCTSNNKFYLGGSQNIEKRLKRHFKDLNRNKHHNLHLQRAFNLFGEENFTTEVVKLCENIKEEEQYLLDKLDWKVCFNISKGACGGDNFSNHPYKEKLREKLNKILSSNRIKNPDLKGSKNPNWKGGISRGKCKCGNTIGPKAKKCIKCSNKGSENPFFGKCHKEITKEKISKVRSIQGYLGNQQKEVVINGKIYSSVSEAGRCIGVTASTIINRIRNPKFKDYKYKD